MDYKVIYTKPFNGYLRDLQQRGQKKVVQAVRAAISEAGMTGEIRDLPRTKHGETRLQGVEKYDLADGHRLVLQIVDGTAKVRAFLFVGSHDDAERWLERHRNYQWTRNRNDGTLEFLQVTDTKDSRHIPADRMDLESPEELLAVPLLRVLSPEQWGRLQLPLEVQAYVEAICSNDYERDAEGILTKLDENRGLRNCDLAARSAGSCSRRGVVGA
jgi:mRNA-degrading endonuclease RelE of RelBE toxin-antitoxin system